MGDTERTLVPGESIVYQSKLHWSLWWGPLGWGLLLAAGTAGAALLVVIPWWIATFLLWLSSEFAVTTQRAVLKTGIVRRRSLELIMNRVESVSVDQGYLARIFNYGTVLIVGTGGSRERFGGIDRPLAFREAVIGQLARASGGPSSAAAP